jgi:hypothetical protein
LDRHVEIGRGSRIIESVFGDYSYTDRFADVAYSTIGKFANIAAFARIDPSQHPYRRASLHHFMYRSSYCWPDEPDEAELFDWRRSHCATIGHDTWIGHGAMTPLRRNVRHQQIEAARGLAQGHSLVGSKMLSPRTIPTSCGEGFVGSCDARHRVLRANILLL